MSLSASITLARASSRVRPWLKTPGTSGDRGEDPAVLTGLVDDRQVELLSHRSKRYPRPAAGTQIASRWDSRWRLSTRM
jgi:hypothetical protein